MTAYEGLESTDYDLLTEENVGYAGERKRRMKILKRPIAIEFDYLGYEDIPEVRQKLIGFFSPYSSGNLTVDFMGTERAIEYEVQKLKFSSQNVFEPISCLLELVCVDPDFQTPYHLMEAISTWVDGLEMEIQAPISHETTRRSQGEYCKRWTCRNAHRGRISRPCRESQSDKPDYGRICSGKPDPYQ